MKPGFSTRAFHLAISALVGTLSLTGCVASFDQNGGVIHATAGIDVGSAIQKALSPSHAKSATATGAKAGTGAVQPTGRGTIRTAKRHAHSRR